MILLENGHSSVSLRNQPGRVSRVSVDTSTRDEKYTYNISCLLILVLLAVLSDGPLRKKWEGGETRITSPCRLLWSMSARRHLTDKPTGSYGNYQEPIEPWHKDCCSWEEPEAGRYFAARAGHLKHLLVPPVLATRIRAWTARTPQKETNV